MLPRGMSKLKNLIFLSNFSVSKDEGANIAELGGLPNISKQLQIWNIENVKSGEEAFEARMMDKKLIEVLELHWSPNADDTNDSQNKREILDKLKPHTNLKVLIITGYRGTTFPDWLGHPSHHNIVDLSLWECRGCCNLPALGQLPSLKKLLISGFDALLTIGTEFYKTNDVFLMTPFASLESLFFYNMPVWQDWYSIGMEAFPKLQYLNIIKCPKLTRYMIRCLALETLKIEECPVLVGCCIPTSVKQLTISDSSCLEFPKQQCYESLESLDIFYSCEDSLTSFSPNTFPNLKQCRLDGAYDSVKCFPGDGLLPASLSSLYLLGFSALETFDFEAFQPLTSLQQLKISFCPKLEKRVVERLAASVTKLDIYKCPLIRAEDLQHVRNVLVF